MVFQFLFIVYASVYMALRPWSKEETPEADRKGHILHTFLRKQS
jgi:hypothetical protein